VKAPASPPTWSARKGDDAVGFGPYPPSFVPHLVDGLVLGHSSPSDTGRDPDVPPPTDDNQLDILEWVGDNPSTQWPDPRRLPHNEGGSRVRDQVHVDLRASESGLLVVGYGSLDEVVRFLANADRSPSMRLLFGNEPFVSQRARTTRRARLSEEVRDYWLRRGFSVLLSADIIRVRQLFDEGRLEARIAQRRTLHAKVYVAQGVSATLGSSNFTAGGMYGHSELNARFEVGDPRYEEAVGFAEALWERGLDYTEELRALLDQLLQAVTWQEAVARGCAEILEGAWAKRYVPPEALANLEPPLWPHQIQGISQAMWTLHNVGSVLVADATGSGKTRMGAWLLRAAYDRLTRVGHAMRVEQVVIAPPAVVDNWNDALQESGLRWKVDSHGPLSNVRAEGHHSLLDAIATTELLAVDEAHNFVNPSGRTRRVLAHYADNVVLFTATPINRGATDLLGMVELLGADNFPDEALDVLRQLQRLRRRGGDATTDGQREMLRRQVGAFMVRRTRPELNRIAADHADGYRLPSGTSARYPRHDAKTYPLEPTAHDIEIAQEIGAIADQLTGVARLGKKLELPPALAAEGISERDYLRRVVHSVAALARHLVLDCLRSSRAALVEHVRGTQEARRTLAREVDPQLKQNTGNTLATLDRLAGRPPTWKFQELGRDEAPPWVTDPNAHAQACRDDRARYDRIADLAIELSDTRERQKVDLLARLFEERGLVLAFDSHVLTLGVFEQRLQERQVEVRVFTGARGKRAKRDASALFGLGREGSRLVALCSDALSEGLNLQGASVVVHLDTPTVIRTAEQRAGRVDRMNSPHGSVELYWPKDPPAFAPRRKDLLRERHEVVSDLIGANLSMPGDDSSDVVPVEVLAQRASIERADDPADLYDAFRPVRALIGPEALIDPRTYDVMRTSQADVVAAISVVRSQEPWGFFAVGGQDRTAPRWVLLDGFEGAPEFDLGRIAGSLRARLGDDPPDHPLDEQARIVMQRLLANLRHNERLLLPTRRQRVLRLVENVLGPWLKQAEDARDGRRCHLLRELVGFLAESPHEGAPTPDLRTLADACLRTLRPVQRKVLEERRGRRRLWRIGELRRPLLQEPLTTDVLEALVADVRLVPPIEERVAAMVVGVPVSGVVVD